MSQVSAGTKGFLFCDLRGYTAFIERSGDQAAAELLAVYRELVREVIARHEGAEIRTEGDSVYVVFPAASGAVEAGLGIVAGAAERSTKERPIAVGVGVHAGETVATTEGLVGGAVNIAARVCAKAQAGEVLVTDTVRALTRTYLPYRFTSLGTQSLKGIAGGIPLYRVEAVPTSGRARLRRQLGARRGRLVLLGGAVVVLLVGLAGAWAANRPADCLILPVDTKDVVARIDPARNCVVAVYPVGFRPGPIAVADGKVWVGNVDDQTISIIDPKTGRTRTTGAGGTPDGLTSGPGAVYILTTTNGVSKIPTQVERIQDSLPLSRPPEVGLPYTKAGALPTGYSGLAFGSDHVWVTNTLSGDVERLRIPGGMTGIHVTDPAPPLSNGSGEAPLGPIAAEGGVVWMADTATAQVFRVDAISGRPTSITTDLAHGGANAIAATPNAVWLLHDDGYLTRMDTSVGGIRSSKVLDAASTVAATDQSVWVVDVLHATVASVDPASGERVASVRVGGHPAGIAIAPDGSAWVTIQGP